MGNSCRVFIAVILIISLFTVSVFATPTGSYDLYSTNGRNVNSFSASGNTYISNFSQHLAYIRVYLDQILAYDANISSTLDYYLPALLQRIVDAFSPAAGDSRSMWQLSSAMVSGITAIQSAALGIAQDVYNISSYVDGIEGSLTSIGSKLDNTNINIQSLEYIKWTNYTDYNVSYSTDNITYTSDLSSLIFGKDFYVKLIGLNLSDTLFYLNFPVYVYPKQFNINFDLNVSLLNYSSFDNFYIIRNFNNTSILINPFYLYGNNESYPVILHFNSNLNIAAYDRDPVIKYIDCNNTDYYNVANFIELTKLNNQNSDLSDIKNILIDIDNNSDFIQNNNDLQINVDIDAADGQGITAIILKLQDLFDFGVGLQEFLVTLNEFDNLHWFTRYETFTQVNYDPRDNVGYQNLYE